MSRGVGVRIPLHNVSTTGVDFRESERTRADSLLPEKPPAVRDFAGKRVRRRGLVSLQSYTFKSCLPDQFKAASSGAFPAGSPACSFRHSGVLGHRWTKPERNPCR